MTERQRKRAERALVRVYRTKSNSGLGFVASGDLIITATHVLPRLPGDFFPGDPLPVDVERVIGGDRFKALVRSAEFCGDVAILSSTAASGTGLVDFPTGLLESYESAMSEMPPRKVLTRPYGGPVWLIGADGRTWFRGVAKGSHITPDAPSRIVGGMSGGPVFADDGWVVGIISSSGEEDGLGHMVILADALPAWALSEIGVAGALSENEVAKRMGIHLVRGDKS